MEKEFTVNQRERDELWAGVDGLIMLIVKIMTILALLKFLVN